MSSPLALPEAPHPRGVERAPPPSAGARGGQGGVSPTPSTGVRGVPHSPAERSGALRGAVRCAEPLPLCGGRVRSPRAAHSGP